jgi:hypothetical protein
MTTQSTTPLLRRLIAGFLFSTLPPRERLFVAFGDLPHFRCSFKQKAPH